LRQELIDHIDDLEEIAGLLKNAFVAKDEFIEIMITCAIAQEHLLVVGPPGTAKSELVKRFALMCSPEGVSENGKVPYFEYLFTRFTEPNEIFGPVDIQKFQEGSGYRRMTDTLLPKAEIAFLDEVFKANSAILNALLTILNERIFYNGGSKETVPLLCSIGATNEVPEDTTLNAIFDRFLVRIWSDNVEDARFGELLTRGWNLEKQRVREGFGIKQTNYTTTKDMREIHKAINEVNIDPVLRDYHEAVRRIRAEGIDVSDRRVIKLLKLIAASALRRKSLEANTGDFWVLRHIWNRQDQIPHLETIVEPYLEGYEDINRSAERSLEKIQGNIELLAAGQDSLATDADYADFLQSAERLRRELIGHSDKDGKQALIERLDNMINHVMELMK